MSRSAVLSGAASHERGLALFAAGRVGEALDAVRSACEAEPRNAAYLSNLCEIARQAGRLDLASAAGERAVALQPDSPVALNNLGVVRFEQARFGEAEALYRRAIRIAPDYVEALSNLGNVLRAGGDREAALHAYQRALALRPAYADAWNNLGSTLRDFGRIEEAVSAYRKAHALRPHNVQVLVNLALALKDLDRPDEAAALCHAALELDPRHAPALTCLAQLATDARRTDEAETLCRRALAMQPDDPDALNVLGLAQSKRGDLDAALAQFRRAIAAKPDLADAHNNLGNVLKELGQFAEADAATRRAVDLEPSQTAYYLNLMDGRRVASDDPFLVALERLEADANRLSPKTRMRLAFALAAAYESLGRHDAAFTRLVEGNRLKRATISYDEAETFGIFDRIAAQFDRARARRPVAGAAASDLPVFVVGMPRSGTSLVEQIIASHPSVHGAGELIDLNEIVAPLPFPELARHADDRMLREIGHAYLERLKHKSPGALRIVDKMPANYVFLGLIHLALPGARIIHVRRDPTDTCASCFSKLFAEEQHHTYDLAELGRYYRKYDALMDHWRRTLPDGAMLEVRYEDLVEDLEGQARRLIGYCGLDWDPRCLDFHQTARPVRTASVRQVRRPIYRSSVGRSAALADHLGPLREALGDLARPVPTPRD
jgi:tetratricopeptide (TPR) repeat protein